MFKAEAVVLLLAGEGRVPRSGHSRLEDQVPAALPGRRRLLLQLHDAVRDHQDAVLLLEARDSKDSGERSKVIVSLPIALKLKNIS